MIKKYYINYTLPGVCLFSVFCKLSRRKVSPRRKFPSVAESTRTVTVLYCNQLTPKHVFLLFLKFQHLRLSYSREINRNQHHMQYASTPMLIFYRCIVELWLFALILKTLHRRSYYFQGLCMIFTMIKFLKHLIQPFNICELF